MDFKDHKYLIDIYRDQHPNIIYMKAAQMGVSEKLISESVWVCDRLGKNVLYVFPTSAQLGDFAQARLEPVFNMSDYLSRITGALTMAEKKDRDIEVDRKIRKIGLKQIRDNFIYFRGSQNQQQIISVDVDMIVLDERDRFIQEHVPYIDKRLLHSDLKWRREASTPTFPGRNIHEAYMNSDQRVWMLTCDYCKTEQEIDFFRNVDYEKKITFCLHCKREIDRLKDGKWVALNPDNQEVHGYKINGIYNTRRTIPELVEMYEKAKNQGFSAMQQFYNQVLGLPYEAAGQSVLIGEMNDCQGNYDLPTQGKICYGGADVGTKIHVVISQKLGDRLRYLYIGTVSEFLGPVDSLEELMNRFDVKIMVIDSRPETKKVREMMIKFPNRVYAAYYPNKKFDIQNYYIYDDNRFEVAIDRTISLDYLVSDIQKRLIELPKNAQYIPDFYDQMGSPQRVPDVNKRTGQPEARWIPRGSDHFFHACNYNRIAVLKGGTSEALLDYLKKPDNNVNKGLGPDSLLGWARWVRLRGERIF